MSDRLFAIKMLSKWCVIVAVLWTVNLSPTLSIKSHTDSRTPGNGMEKGMSQVSRVGLSEHSSRALSLSEIVKQIPLNGYRFKRDANMMMLKMHLSNGSYLYRKVKMPDSMTLDSVNKKASKIVTRVARGYSNPKGSKGAYGYKKKSRGYVYTTPKTTTTRAPPIGEQIIENDSQSLLPSDETPPDSSADRFAETTPLPVEDPWDIRNSIPGEPGQDYKVYGSIPETNFTCEGRTPGFYADTETGCQVFHRCTDDPWYTGQVRVTQDSFLCPNGSLFNQQIYTCDWWGNVNCDTAPEFYQLNEQIGQLEETNAGTVQYVQFSGVRVPPPPGQKRKAPRIIPKRERKPLPEEYRSNKRGSNEGGAGSTGLSSGNSDDPEGLALGFGQEARARPLSVSTTGVEIEQDEDDKDGSSQNIDEVSEIPPTTKRPKKASKNSLKKSKKTTTTTTTATPEESDEENEEEEEEDDDDAEEDETPEATKSNPLIVNRERNEDERTELGLEPPTGNFQGGSPVDNDDATKDNDVQATEGPTYIPPTTEATSGGYSYPKPEGYLPPNNEYLPPKQNNTYLPPKKEEGGYASPPTNTYLPPTSSPNVLNTHSSSTDSYYGKTSTGYGNPQSSSFYASTTPQSFYQQPNREYLSPNQQNQPQQYGPPQQQNQYLPPQQSNQYLPPQGQQSNQYLPPQGQQSNQYLPPQGQQSNQYLPPQGQQSNQYLPPQGQQSNQYLPPQRQESNLYGPPQQHKSNQYLPPQRQESNQYGPPQQHKSNQYLPPQGQQSNQYLPPQRQESNQYGPPQQHKSNQYLPPQGQQSNQYLPPQGQQSNQYLPPQGQQSNQYLPPQGQQSNQYLPPQKQEPQNYLPPQSNQYLPPQKQESNQYLLPKSQQSNQYLPPQSQLSDSNRYLSPQNSNREYLPPQQGYPSPTYATTTVTTHWPAKYDYEAPTSPSSVQQYSIIPSQFPTNQRNYGTPNQNQNYNQAGYTTIQNELVSPTSAYQQLNANQISIQNLEPPESSNQNQNLQQASPTENSFYSTIPIQTPPPRDDAQNVQSFNAVNSPLKVEFLPVPLVSYSESVKTNSNTKKR